MKLRIYLAGAIRDGRAEDIEWRERIISDLAGMATWLNPLGDRWYDPHTGHWSMSGITPSASIIVPHDFWMVEHSDIIIFNLTAMAEGYPNIGTLVEFGHATALHPRPLLYTVTSQPQRLHPFLSESSAAVFGFMVTLTDFLRRHLPVLEGSQPRFATR